MAALSEFQVERTLRTLVAKVPHTIAMSRVSVAQTVHLTENVVGLLDALAMTIGKRHPTMRSIDVHRLQPVRLSFGAQFPRQFHDSLD